MGRAERLVPAAASRALRIVATASLIVALGGTGAAQGATYKWVDEKGVVHYTDTMPPEALNKGSTMLDKQGRAVKRVDPALTTEQRRTREAEEEQAKAAAKTQEAVARRDRALVSSYTTEGEIDLARSRALATIDSQIESARAYLAHLEKRKVELAGRRAAQGNGPLPAALERELEGNQSELDKTVKLIEQKQKERAVAVARYDADKARFRELKATEAAGAASAAASTARAASTDPTPTRPAPVSSQGSGRM